MSGPEVLPRLRTWVHLWSFSSVSLIDLCLVILGGTGLVSTMVRRMWKGMNGKSGNQVQPDQTQNRLTGFLFLTVLFVLIVLTLVRFHLYQRYLVVLVPFIGLALSSAMHGIHHLRNRYVQAALITFLLSLSLCNHGQRLDMNGDYDGLEEICTYIKANVSPGDRVYEHRLEWHLYSMLHDHRIDMRRYDHSDVFPDPGDIHEKGHAYCIDDVTDHLSFSDMNDTLRGYGISTDHCRDGYDRNGNLRYVLYRLEPIDSASAGAAKSGSGAK